MYRIIQSLRSDVYIITYLDTITIRIECFKRLNIIGLKRIQERISYIMEENELFIEESRAFFDPHKKILFAMVCFAAAIFLWFCQLRLEDAKLASRIAPEILRFHVIANSNSKEDQDLKLQVKSFLLEKIYQENQSAESPDKNKLVSYLAENQKRLEQETEQFIQKAGKSYPVSIKVVQCEFPEKYYGDLRLPAGLYETAQVRIGEGLGHNWWCVLYPRVCITKDALAVIPESSKKELEALLSSEDFTALKAERPAIHIDFRFLQIFKHSAESRQSVTEPVLRSR